MLKMPFTDFTHQLYSLVLALLSPLVSGLTTDMSELGYVMIVSPFALTPNYPFCLVHAWG